MAGVTLMVAAASRSKERGTSSSDFFGHWWEPLRALMPVTGLLHIGAGNGLALPPYAAWQLQGVMLVEADRELQPELAAIARVHRRWTTHAALVGERDEEADYFHASNPNESGVLAPESLSRVWRNLKTRERTRLRAITVRTLLAELPPPAPAVNWLVVDCLPALPVLRGAGDVIRRLEIVAARVLLDESALPEHGSTKGEVDAFLSPLGFHCLAVAEERHPAVGMALYARDWKAAHQASEHALMQRDTEKAQHAKIAAERQAQLQTLTQAHAELDKTALQRQAQFESLSQGKAAAEKAAADRATQVEQLTKARDEQARLATERNTQLQQLTQAKVAAEKLAQERQAQLDSMAQAKAAVDKIAAERSAQIEHITKTRDEQTRLAADRQTQANERQQRIQDLEAQLSDTEVRQHLLQEELVKAEGQLELIKDLLLREQSL